MGAFFGGNKSSINVTANVGKAADPHALIIFDK
jgi:hypothetical protein